MPIVWTDRFPKNERLRGYLRLMRARQRFHTHYRAYWKGWRPGFRKFPGYKHQLASWKNKYKGKRCFVLGNGPSLKEMDLSPLKDEITIGCNGIYKLFPDWGWQCNYILFEDIEQTELRRKDIPTIKGSTKLAGVHNAYAFPADDETYFMNVRNLDVPFMEDLFPQFSEDFPHIVHLASTVTYIGLQLAYHLGCNPVYLIGVDHNYGELPRLFPPCKLTITEDNIHLVRGLHIQDDYYKVGDVIGVPPVDYMEAGYRKAGEAFEADGRKILNAGKSSALDVYDKVSFPAIFSGQPAARTPRILFISHDAGQLGAQVFLLNLLREFNQRYGMDCQIVIREPNGVLIPQFEAEGKTHIFWPDPNNKVLGPEQPAIKAALEKWKPDVVYANTATNGDVIAYLDLDAPVVVHTHELQWYMSLLDEKRHDAFVKRTDLHIACSQAVKRNLMENHGIPEEIIEVVYEAIDYKALEERLGERSAADVRKELGVPAHAVLVGNCGRIDERKGWDLFIAAAERVIKEAPEDTPVHFLWVGHGPNHQDLLQEAKTRGIAANVHAPGPQSNPFPFFEAMDLEAMCSRDDPFPLVVMESAYLGCPVLAFAGSGGAPEFIQDDHAGIVVPEMSADALADCLLELVRDPERRAKMSENAKVRAREFDIRAASPQVVRHLHQRMSVPLPLELQDAPAAPSGAAKKPKAAPALPPAPPARTLHFPEDVSLGELQARDWGSSKWEWAALGDARGTVSVPAGQEVYLILSPQAAGRIDALSALQPDDLQSLALTRTTVLDEQLPSLKHLTGLRTLDLRATPVTDVGLAVLRNLVNLRGLVLPSQISDAALDELQEHLDYANVQRAEGPPTPRPDAGQTRAAAPRSILFPDTTVGLLMTRAWNLPIWNWQELGPAKAAVNVPAGQELLLVVYPEYAKDLSCLRKLDPHDLQSLHLRAAPIDDAQLPHIAHLQGLRTLDLRDTRITSSGLNALAPLTNLKTLWLPGRLAGSARAQVSGMLPHCKVHA